MRILIALLCLAASIALAVSFFFDFYLVRGKSMLPTLVPGDIISCMEIGEYNRGDVVIFDDPSGQVEYIIKRIVAMPNDDVMYVGKVLVVGGSLASKRELRYLGPNSPGDILLEQVLFKRRFQIYEAFGPSTYNATMDRIEGYFVLGDNRDASSDSRDYGVVPASAIRCKVLGVIAPEINGYLHRSRSVRIYSTLRSG